MLNPNINENAQTLTNRKHDKGCRRQTTAATIAFWRKCFYDKYGASPECFFVQRLSNRNNPTANHPTAYPPAANRFIATYLLPNYDGCRQPLSGQVEN